MQDYRNPSVTGQSTDQASIHQGLRTHMLSVYNHMLVGLLLTAGVSYAFSLILMESESLANMMFNTPLKWVIMLAPLGAVIFLSVRIHKLSAAAARLTFYVYAAINGISLSFIALAFSGTTIASAFAITAVTFGAMSLWGYTTKRDLTGMGSFLMMGVIGLCIASIVNIFLGSSLMHFIISALGVLIFTGLTAYDTQKIRDFYFEVQGDETMTGRAAIMGALALYLDFINIFLHLLSLLRGED